MTQQRQPLLILDLDETLVHATEPSSQQDYDFLACEYFVYKRPYVREFLDRCLQYFELAVWTSSGKDYARDVVQAIFQNIPLSFVWSRERCTLSRNIDGDRYVWIKDLKKVKRKGFALESVIIVDDSPEKLQRNYGNLIRIRPFEGDQNDRELQYLAQYLPTLTTVENVRQIEKRHWRSTILAQGR